MLPQWMLAHSYLIIVVAICIVALAIYVQVVLHFDMRKWTEQHDPDADAEAEGEKEQNEREGFETIPLTTDPVSGKLPDGYYQVDDFKMAKIPYGYTVNPGNPKMLIPLTNTAVSKQNVTTKDRLPLPGEMLPDGYYFDTATSLGLLPPNMMPKVDRIDVTGTPPKILVFYKPGYVSETEFYAQRFTPAHPMPSPIPPGPPRLYFADANKLTVSFLPYGKVPDVAKGWGFTSDTNLISPTGNFDITNKTYSDLSNNYDVQFHGSVEDMMKQNDFYDVSFGQTIVLDKDGKPVIMPAAGAQSPITYYQPGSFPFGSSSYIPMYEDSVYLSRTTNQSSLSPYKSTLLPQGACSYNKDFPAKQEEYCRSLTTDQCASNSCCILLGGEKCVAGNSQGPLFKANYSDFLLQNKDRYYHNGQCYGNC